MKSDSRTVVRSRHVSSALRLVAVATSLISVSVAQSAAAYADGYLDSSDWTTAYFTSGPGGSAAVRQVPSGGFPGLYRENSIDHNGASSGNPSQVMTFHLSVDALYSPQTQGAINLVDWSIDTILLQAFPGADGFACGAVVQQGGTIYGAPLGHTREWTWTNKSLTGLTSQSFARWDSARMNWDWSRHPDFSTSGTTIRFGYFMASTHTTPGSQLRRVGADNFSVIVHHTGLSANRATLTDGSFGARAWSSTVSTGGPSGTGSGQQAFVNGNPRSYRWNDIVHNAASTSNKSQVAVFHFFEGATYSPRSGGSIQSIDWSMDTILTIGFPGFGGFACGPILRQNGRIYGLHTHYTPEWSWTHKSASGLSDVSFERWDGFGVGWNRNYHPNLTATGDPITFGYFVASTHTGGSPQHRQVGCDNWTVKIDRSSVASVGRYTTYGTGCAGGGSGSMCAGANTTASNLLGIQGGAGEYAMLGTTTGAAMIVGFEILASAPVPSAIRTAIYAIDANGDPTGTPLQTGTMTVGTAVQWYRTTFAAPVTVAAGDFALVFENPSVSLTLPIPTAGTPSRHGFRAAGATAWDGPYQQVAWAWRAVCSPRPGPVPQLTNAGVPETGTSFDVELQDAKPSANCWLLHGISDSTYGALTLPFDLGVIGAPTCYLLASGEVVIPATTTASGTAAVAISLPNDPRLVGTVFFNQWIIADAAANSLGLYLSDAGRGTVGG